MKEVEKRELFEQEQKIFEAGVQRADKRSGSFSFLTWPFFIAPLIACEEFLAAMFKPAAAEEEAAKAAQAGPAPQVAKDDPLRLHHFIEDTVVLVVLPVRAVHDKAPHAAWCY